MKKLLIIIGVVAVIAAVIASSRSNPENSADPVVLSGDGGVALTPEEQKEIAQDKEAVVSETAAARYTHPRLGFSFEKPQGYTVGSLKGEDGSEAIIVQPSPSVIPAKAGIQSGFQIFINPLDEPLELTPVTIQRELPGTAVDNPLKITLDGVSNAIMFGSNNENFGGKSSEIWFVYPEPAEGRPGNVYQITSYAEFAKQLQQIIGTWKFGK